jgi:lipoprotein-releasing system permease protein
MKPARILWIARRFGASLRRRGFIAFTRAVAIGSIAIGCMALLISLAVLDGFQQALEENAVRFTAHLRIQTYADQPASGLDISALRASIKGIESIQPAFQREGLVRSASGQVDGILLKGIDDIVQEFTIRPKNLQEGKAEFSADTAHQIIIGAKLARRLGCKAGSQLLCTIMLQSSVPMAAGTALPTPMAAYFTVKGIFSTGMAQYDDLYAFVPRLTLAGMAGMQASAITHYDVMVQRTGMIKAVTAQLDNKLSFPFFVQSVYDLHAGMFNWIEMQKQPIPIVLSLISIVAVLNILTALLIAVIEKTRSIGILLALGMQKNTIIRMFIVQGMLIGVAGISIGCMFSLALCKAQQYFGLITLKSELYFVDRLPVNISVWHYVIVCGVALLLTFISTFIPALLAARVQPVKALRFS